MRTGTLRERVTFQARTRVDDGYGNTIGPWDAGFTVWARLQPLRGGEAVLAGRLQGTQTYVLRVRSSAATRAVTPAWRAFDARAGLREDGEPVRPFNIRSAADMSERGEAIDFLVEEGVAT